MQYRASSMRQNALNVTRQNAKKATVMDEEFSNLSDNDYIAFMQLEAEFRKDFEERTQGETGPWEYIAADYMNKTLAAATALGIDALLTYDAVPSSRDSEFHEYFTSFLRDVDSILIQIRVTRSRRAKANSVGLTAEQKTKIHALVEKIRVAIEQSSASIDKKEKLYQIIGTLSEEVNKVRTGLERFGDLARGLAGISREVAEEGAEPWWKWFKAALGVVDEAKDAEPQLPKPKEVKRIQPPRKSLPKPDDEEGYGTTREDDIPF